MLPKHEWRLPTTRRTLDSLPMAPLLAHALPVWTRGAPPRAIVEVPIAMDGQPTAIAEVRRADPKGHAVVFDLEWTSGEVNLHLNREACAREVHAPSRESRHLLTLRPWRPMRVLLNGRADFREVRYYFLQDYHVLLCDRSAPPDPMPAARTFDLQADLI
jgi:hypothetical protein